MKWEQGRQGTGYLKKLLLQGFWFDLWLLKYPAGTWIPTHVDKVPQKRHYRLNIVLKGSWRAYRGEALFKLGPVVLFRPDIMPHNVATIDKERIVLSFGWVRSNL